MRESLIEKQVCAHARKAGWACYKFVSPGHRSVPDRLFIGPTGFHCYIEFKSPGKRPTPLQERELRLLKERGVEAEWFDDAVKAIRWLDKLASLGRISAPI